MLEAKKNNVFPLKGTEGTGRSLAFKGRQVVPAVLSSALEILMFLTSYLLPFHVLNLSE